MKKGRGMRTFIKLALACHLAESDSGLGLKTMSSKLTAFVPRPLVMPLIPSSVIRRTNPLRASV
jgi:hypothetical protein